jgi:hypothetical protein
MCSVISWDNPNGCQGSILGRKDERQDADNSVKISGLRANIIGQEKLALAEESVEYKMQRYSSKSMYEDGAWNSQVHAFINQGLFDIVQVSSVFQKWATTDLSTCRRWGSIYRYI